MGNNNSANSRVCTGNNAPGLNQLCYTRGFDAAQMSVDPNLVNEGLDALACRSNANAHRCYVQGFVDGMNKNHNYGGSNSNQQPIVIRQIPLGGNIVIMKTTQGEYLKHGNEIFRVAPGCTMEGKTGWHMNNGYIYPGSKRSIKL